MNNYLKDIESKIKENLKIEKLNIVDNSEKHKSHKFFDSQKYHIRLEIESIYLKKLNKIDAQREIFKILKEDLKNKIHALEIKIK
jgi:BolA family transcriptional regulator, general stress-responsive regulator|tara:strand:- start:177 stop:431 length:255 start_codon:yes stop_codon:yes gene_type:complete